MVGDHHPLLPVTVSWNDHVDFQYYYSKHCGHLMSVKVMLYTTDMPTIPAMLFAMVNHTYKKIPLTIRVHKGKFQKSQLVSEICIVIKYIDDETTTITTTTTITKDNCQSYKDTFDEKSDVIQEFNMNIFFNKFDIVSIN
jgi:hypothetical protein